jgi:hypothetical protein
MNLHHMCLTDDPVCSRAEQFDHQDLDLIRHYLPSSDAKDTTSLVEVDTRGYFG